MSSLYQPEALLLKAAALSESYRSAEPFPSIAIDDLFEPSLLDRVISEFPPADDETWIRRRHRNSDKLESSREEELGPATQSAFRALSEPPFLSFLETLTGIDGLIADPYFEGGGLHMSLPGGKLNVHADFNWHAKLRLHRRINVLVYLNRDWPEHFGGQLELWNEDATSCQASFLPLFNRTVVFTTTDRSFHGHPIPVACPPGRGRKSISAYYYTASAPTDGASEPHSTIYVSGTRRGRNGLAGGLIDFGYRCIRALTPPILMAAARRFVSLTKRQ